MELYIRSQDKSKLMKMGDLYVDFNGDVDPKKTPYRVVIDKFVCLGVYKDEKRALEVLDEIQKILMPPMLINNIEGFITGKDDSMHIINPSYNEIEQPATYVYEMPKE